MREKCPGKDSASEGWIGRGEWVDPTTPLPFLPHCLTLYFVTTSEWVPLFTRIQKWSIALHDRLLAMRTLKLFKTLNTLKMTTAPVFETSVTLNWQQSYSGLRSPGRSNSIYFWNDSWVQTFHSIKYSAALRSLGFLNSFIGVWFVSCMMYGAWLGWFTKHSSIHTDNLQLNNHGSLDISFVRTISGSNEKTIFSEPGCLKHQSYKEMFELKVKLPEIFENHLIFWRWLSKSHRVFFADCLYNIVSLILTASLGRQ